MEGVGSGNRLDFDVSHEDYHRRTLGVASKTALAQFRKSPAHYRAWIDGADHDTPALRLGRVADLYTLDPARALELVAIRPDFEGKGSKAARAEWEAENAGKEQVSQDEWDQARRIGDSVHKHTLAARLIQSSKAQASAYWTHGETGIKCKARLDLWDGSRRVIGDMKTAIDASGEGFAKAVVNFGYDVQAAFYSDGLEAISEHPVKGFVFIVVEKEPPYAVATYMLDERALQRGREIYQRDLDNLKVCIDRDEWPGYPEGITTLSLPHWSYR